MTVTLNKILRVSLYFFIVLLSTNKLFAQDKAIKNKQKALFVLNIAQTFEWGQENQFSPFHLIVLGDSILYSELRLLSKNRTIQGRKIKVVYRVTTNSFSNVDLIYCNNNYGYNASKLLKVINQRKILLLGENYKFNECMVNLLEFEDDFFYELNSDKLKGHGFTIPQSLIQQSISSESKWFEMYQRAQETLENEVLVSQGLKKEINNQKIVLRNLETKLEEFNLNIDKLTDEMQTKTLGLDNLQISIDEKNGVLLNKLQEIDQLKSEITINKFRYLRQMELVDSFNLAIVWQTESLKKQTDKLASQNGIITNQTNKITNQKEILKHQENDLENQQKVNFLLLALLILLAFILFLLYMFYMKGKSYNKILESKNRDIEERNKEIEQFAYIASHDLQAPLNTVIGFVNLLELKLEEKLDKEDKVNMGFIKQSSERMKDLIKDLLEYSKIGEEAVFEKINVKELLDTIIQDLQVNVEHSNATIKIDDPGSIIIDGLKTEIRMLFQNVITNAIKFKKKDIPPIINVSISQTKGPFVVKTFCSISDNGIGIEKKYREQIFEVFNRLHNESEYEGTGIGLAHCKKIVHRHLGRIWAEESDLGGTNICFYLLHYK